jgi:uncharacterized 2Fe-2S/4Fe-4S cluster protein (DUF4445 family)
MDKALETPTRGGLGIAFDIGTATVAGSSVDLNDGRTIKTHTLKNPQARWGEDVLSRIRAISEDPALLIRLKKSVIGACNEIIEVVSGPSPSKKRAIKKVIAAGNTVMEHILVGVSPVPLGRVPYRPAFKKAQELEAKGAGLDVGPSTTLYTFPIIGGFVGGDTVAVILSLGLHKGAGTVPDRTVMNRTVMNRRVPDRTVPDRTVLAIDIGTNSEIVLSTPTGLFCASSPAGPAFEGGEIEHGMTAGKGAIQGVKIEEDRIRLDFIGTSRPKGICGSGLVDAAAALLISDVIEPSGRIRNRQEVKTNLSNYIEEGNGANSFVLFRGAEGEIRITQSDIRALQVAKAAISAGINVLLKKAKLEPRAIDKVYLAGAFGSNLSKEGLGAIGVLKREWLGRVTSVGDAALEGARLALVSEEKKSEANEIARRAKYVALSGSAHFEREFIANMNFRA